MTVDLSDGVLLDYQKRWIADESQLKIVEKSRRTGMTWAEAADAVLTASLVKSDGGHDHYYLGAGKEMASEFIDACADWALQFGEACGEIEEEILKDGEKDITTYKIPFASGFKIMALSSKPSNLRGRQGSLTVDEAAFHEHLDEVLKAAQAFTMWGGKVRVISTHNGVDNLFNELIQDSRAGKRDFSVHRLTLDDACQDGLYKRICLVRGKTWSQEKEDEWKAKLLRGTATKDDALEEYYCVPKQGGGVYLSRTLIAFTLARIAIRHLGNTLDHLDRTKVREHIIVFRNSKIVIFKRRFQARHVFQIPFLRQAYLFNHACAVCVCRFFGDLLPVARCIHRSPGKVRQAIQDVPQNFPLLRERHVAQLDLKRHAPLKLLTNG
jgi:phage FluMu gp28-like protein